MRDVFKALSAEGYRLSRSKFTLIATAAVLILAMAVTALVFGVIYGSEKYRAPQPPTQENREYLLLDYAESLKECEEFLKQAETVGAPAEVKNKYRELCAAYRFYIDTGTVESDYIALEDTGDAGKAPGGTAFLFFSAKILVYPLLLLAIMGGIIAYSSAYKSGVIKNTAAAPVGRFASVMGKYLLAVLFSLCALVLAAVFSLIFANIIGFENVRVISAHGDGCRAVSALSLYVTRLSGIFILMLLFSALSVLFGELTKSSLGALLLSAAFLGLAILAKLLLYDNNTISQYGEHYYRLGLYFVNYLPVVNIINYQKGFDGTFALLLGYNLLLAAYAVIMAGARFRKRDL